VSEIILRITFDTREQHFGLNVQTTLGILGYREIIEPVGQVATALPTEKLRCAREEKQERHHGKHALLW